MGVAAEVAGEGNLVAHFGFGVVDPGVGDVGWDPRAKYRRWIVGPGDVFGVAGPGLVRVRPWRW